MKQRSDIPKMQRWVIKVGSALVTNEGRGLDLIAIAAWVDQMASLMQQGMELVLVSSGAVAEGMSRLGWKTRPQRIHELQAAAAVGQMGLVQAYESQFRQYSLHTAQILLTHADLVDRERYLNARSTLRNLIQLKVIPVINENDTVTTDEIKFGDNDSLAAMVANLIEADLLVILTDQLGVFDSDPRLNPDAKLISSAEVEDPKLEQVAGAVGGSLGRGGMVTKIKAGKRAARSGASTVIVGGRQDNVLLRVRNAEDIGTFLSPASGPVVARKQWLASHLQVRGTLTLDAGATRVLKQSGSSLLVVGVTNVEGNFQRGDMVACLDVEGREVARGLVNYNAEESRKLMGVSSSDFETILGYIDDEELIHRDNLVLV